ncbi:histone chaperone ASF1 [Trypanosoma rangeli]|uniref:Histone chaperone ASF1 n=1 Tax=Trypanosoma rangeli TaxID=5698 RepID=A0A422ND92_TRYRA|nr:histone chaperone ASF1 [Trypanosoma rangeli]RNF03451.1 histone chaperone ASF1 [Trypanosoma rangeli]|eukprot:RNF03451.1 histone chaperone ASF1 [Trypanosoma rangeli]
MTTRLVLRDVSVVGNNPAPFSDPIALKVVLEVFEKPPVHAIDVKFTWKPIWDFPVDQELDEFEVGPLSTLGRHELMLQSDPPDFAQIPDPTGPTALIVSFTYMGREFLHLGYNAVVTCEGEMPDVFENAEPLRRHLAQCFPKQLAIVWDENTGDLMDGTSDNDNKSHSEAMTGGSDDDDEDDGMKGECASDSESGEPPLKKLKK